MQRNAYNNNTVYEGNATGVFPFLKGVPYEKQSSNRCTQTRR